MKVRVNAEHVEAGIGRWRKFDNKLQLPHELPIYLSHEARDLFEKAEDLSTYDALNIGLLAARSAYRSR